MAWPTKTQFKAVERIPVPEAVRDAFVKLRSANIGAGYARSVRNGGGFTSSINSELTSKWLKAGTKIEKATEEAAGHFGGDTGKMMTHFDRWTRWKGAAMGVGEMVLPRESYEKGMKAASEAYETPAIRKARVKPIRRGGI
jgi:hypothetical protein